MRNANILVSAGAGSGKTAVLTERIIRLIEEGCSILDFAICTFTEDATLEMKTRIKGKLMDKGMEREADLVYLADISTIHSLCRRIIKDNFDIVNLPPKFTVLTNEAVLKEQAMLLTLNEIFEDNEFREFALKFSPKDDTRIKDLIYDSYNFAMNLPDYREVIKKHILMYENKDYSLIKAGFCRMNVYELSNLLLRYQNSADTLPLTDGEAAIMASDISLLEHVIEMLKSISIPTGNFSYKTMPKNPPNKDEINALRNIMKDKFSQITKCGDLFDCDEILKDAAKDLGILLKAIIAFEENYSKLKMEKGFLTFNDMEQYAYRILQNDRISQEYKNRYKYIFVDEYQDTSKLQQAILERLSGEKNMFMVGDIKQSIYGFRNADPSMFHRIYNEYNHEGDNIKIDLFRNYRSNKGILDFVNSVFSILLNLSETYYPKEAYLKTDTNPDTTPVEIDIVETKEAEPFRIVKRIKDSLNAGYSPKDIAVLFRSVKTETATMVYRLLRSKGIAVDISKSDDELYMECNLFIDFLSIIDNPDNDIPLISVMYSDLGGFSIDDLIEIRKGKKDSFYTCVKTYNDNPKLKQRIADFLSMLEMFAMSSRTMAVDELMFTILMHTGYLRYVEMQKDGRAKASQLYQLIKTAKEFEAMGYYGLSGFLEYFTGLSQLKSTEI